MEDAHGFATTALADSNMLLGMIVVAIIIWFVGEVQGKWR